MVTQEVFSAVRTVARRIRLGDNRMAQISWPLQIQTAPAKVYHQMLVEFKEFMEKERGLSPATVEHRCNSIRPFLDRLLSQHRSLDLISVADIDCLLAQKVNEHHYARVSVRGYASSLRSFFRYAEMRGWCSGGIAASIMAHHVFQHETLPSGPTWDVVQKLLDATSGDQPTMIRDHAILLVLAVYGVRSSEVRSSQASGFNIHSGIANCELSGSRTITTAAMPRRRYRTSWTATP
jgi:site-specific recombinase XerD